MHFSLGPDNIDFISWKRRVTLRTITPRNEKIAVLTQNVHQYGKSVMARSRVGKYRSWEHH